jgi:O-antigen ligase
VALFVLQRTPVLFFRQRTADVIGGPVNLAWQEDTLVRLAFLLVEAAVLLVALRVCDIRSVWRQWPLLVFLGFVALSTTWSVEPSLTLMRAVMLIGTTAVGWYLGQRFRVEQLVCVVAVAVALGALLSLVSAAVWPDLARATNGYPGNWSGIYINRNDFGVVMATGLLALPFLPRRLPLPAKVVVLLIGALEAYFVLRSGSRTAFVALVVAAAVFGFVLLFRVIRCWGVSALAGAGGTAAVAGLVSVCVHWNWATLLRWLGRDSGLTRRTTLWDIDRQFIAERPVQGWGFEAIWSHSPAVERATVAFQGPQGGLAHNGYFEILLGAGKVGFGIFLVVLALTLWRVFAFAWEGRGLGALWPLTMTTFVLVVNFSESFFVANEALWALLVAAGVATARARPVGERP